MLCREDDGRPWQTEGYNFLFSVISSAGPIGAEHLAPRLEIKCLICWNTVRITTRRISLIQLSFPNRCTLNRIGERAQVRCLFAIQPFDPKKPQARPGPCSPRRDGPTEPFITRHFTIALCHQRDCWKSGDWMCRLGLLVIKRRGVTINSRVSFALSSVWPVCPAGHNDKRTSQSVEAYQGVGAGKND